MVLKTKLWSGLAIRSPDYVGLIGQSYCDCKSYFQNSLSVSRVSLWLHVLSERSSDFFHNDRRAVGEHLCYAGHDFVRVVAHADDGIRTDFLRVLH